MQPNQQLFLKNISLILALVFTASACTTLDPYTREEKTSHATRGAAIGAAAGAVIGAVTGGDRLKRAAIGAGVGALAGAGVGYYMDQQEMRLRQQLEGTGVSVTRVGDNIVLNMPGNITFATDSANIAPGFYEVLDSVVLVLKEYEKTVIVVEGHTDSSGGEQYNQLLSERRADAVARFLIDSRVIPARVASYGFGESRPIADNQYADGRAANRRVELTLMPITQ